LLKPATSDQVQAALALTCERFAEMECLRDQVAHLQGALEARKLMARAKGLVMQRYRITEEEAHRWMQKEASRSNTKLVDLARALVAAESLRSEEAANHRRVRQGGSDPEEGS
jgi:response regulator NasT